jgi:hypothetical protein
LLRNKREEEGEEHGSEGWLDQEDSYLIAAAEAVSNQVMLQTSEEKGN